MVKIRSELRLDLRGNFSLGRKKSAFPEACNEVGAGSIEVGMVTHPRLQRG